MPVVLATFSASLSASDRLAARGVSRSAAKKAGLKFYQGHACINGHDGIRYTNNHVCFDCQRLRNAKNKDGYATGKDQSSLRVKSERLREDLELKRQLRAMDL